MIDIQEYMYKGHDFDEKITTYGKKEHAFKRFEKQEIYDNR